MRPPRSAHAPAPVAPGGDVVLALQHERTHAASAAGAALVASALAVPQLSEGAGDEGDAPTMRASRISMYDLAAAAGDAATAGASDAAAAAARGYPALLDSFSLHHVLIRAGTVLDATPEFQSFARTHRAAWGAVRLMLGELAALCARAGVALAVVDGRALAALAVDRDLGPVPPAQLVACCVNREAVERQLSRVGRLFVGAGAREAAATRIQALYRMHRVRRQYLRFGDFISRVRRVQIFWRLRVMRMRTRRLIASRRAERAAAFAALSLDFAIAWPKLCVGRRTIVHLPSFSFAEHVRATTPALSALQASQLPRLADLAEPLVDVVLIAAAPVPDDALAYYCRLLAMQGAPTPAARMHLVVPEHAAALGDRSPLAFALLTSPKAMRRVRNLVAGRAAYLVPSVVSEHEEAIAVELGIPVLGAGAARWRALTSKRGVRSLVADAGIAQPPGAAVASGRAAVLDTLAALVARHMPLSHWLLKIDDEFGGRGHAVVDASHLPCYDQLRSEHSRYGPGWFADFHQEAVRQRVRRELPRVLAAHLVVACPALYPTWRAFIEALGERGGTVEAMPARALGAVAASVLVAPDGGVHLLGTMQPLFAADFQYCGGVVPQETVTHDALATAALAVGRQCHAQACVGFISVDFVAYAMGGGDGDAAADDGAAAGLWAVDVDLGLSDALVSARMIELLTHARGLAPDGSLLALVGEPPRPQPRVAVFLSHAHHSALAELSFAAFFALCRELGVAWSKREVAGVVFGIREALASGVLGVYAVGLSRADAGLIFVAALKRLAAHCAAIGAPVQTNFAEAVRVVHAALLSERRLAGLPR